MNFVNIFNGTFENEEIYNPLPFNLDDFQKEANYRIFQKENILLTAHTGSGKTVPAIFAIHEALKNNKKIIYTSPIKTLSNQKYDELKSIFGIETIGIMTGDIKLNPDAQCIIMTTEILRNILYKGGHEAIDPSTIGYVVFDEVHYFNDPHRGKVWEECIILLDPSIILVMLSATIDKPEIFACWIGRLKQKKINVISTFHRVVPLTHYIFDPENEKLDVILDKHKKYQNYDLIKKKYKKIESLPRFLPYFIDYLMYYNYTPTLFFKFSRQQCIYYARCIHKNLLTNDEMKELTILYNKLVNPIKKQYSHLHQFNEIERLIFKGVCYHHSGLIPVLKEVVEIIYGHGLIKILFATETFAVGVNKPVKTVVFSELSKFDNNGMRFLRSDEYTQMAGRAGRRGLDKVGHVILIPSFDLPSNNELHSIISGRPPSIQSKFGLTYQFILKNLINQNNILDTLNNTFLNLDLKIQMESIESSLKNEEDKLKQYELNSSIKKLLEEYDTIQEKLKDNYIKPSQKQLKNYKKQLKNIQSQIHNFDHEYELFIIIKSIENNIKKYKHQKNNIENYFIHNYRNMYIILESNGFIENGMITSKGNIAIFTNECHELILSDLVEEGFFNDKSCNDILLYLSLFIEEENDEKCYLSDYQLIDEVIKENIKYIQSKFDNYNDIQNKYQLVLGDYQEKINISFLMPVYIWINNLPLQEIYNYTNMFEGNFVKGLLKLNNIVEDLKSMLEECEFLDTLKILENSESMIIKDFVNVNSLYL